MDVVAKNAACGPPKPRGTPKRCDEPTHLSIGGSGFSKHTGVISFSDPSLNNTIDITTEDYDISCNIFQTIFTAINTEDGTLIDRGDNPYSVQIFDSNSTEKQYYDLSYIPHNYIPYRYIDLPFIEIIISLTFNPFLSAGPLGST